MPNLKEWNKPLYKRNKFSSIMKKFPKSFVLGFVLGLAACEPLDMVKEDIIKRVEAVMSEYTYLFDEYSEKTSIEELSLYKKISK